MDPSDLDLTQVIETQEETEDQNANKNIRGLLKLEVDVAPPKFLTFTLKAGPNLVGRSHVCDVIIGNRAVSKQHALLNLDKDGITITDLGSQNKTKIGKRALKPEVCFNLDYNETFFLAGIPAHVLRADGAGDDTGSDTCSESLLNAVEVAEDQAGVVEPVVHSNSSTVDCNSEKVEGELGLPTSSSAAGGKPVIKLSPQNDSKVPPSSHESRSSGSFNLPEMPSLEYTQSDSSQPTGPCAEDGPRKKDGAAEASQDAHMLAGNDPSVGSAAGTCNAAAPKDVAGLQDDDVESAGGACLRQDELPGDKADEVDRLNAPTQPYNTEYSEVTCLRQDGLPGDEADEADRLNAPTQPYNTQYEVTCLRQDGLPGDEADEVDRLNAPTQPYIDDARSTEVAPLRSGWLPGADADDDRFNAPTQGFEDEGIEEAAKSRNAPVLTSEADDEQERLNAVTQSLPNDENGEDEQSDRGENEETYGRTLAGDRTRRLLSSGPSDLSFVLCEATQPDKEDDYEDYCPPTQKDVSPVLKVHALLKSSKERREAVNEEGDETCDETDDETPNLSPKTTVDETPPHSPSFVPESDPEDDDQSMVTARHSLSLLNSTGLTVYEDCRTPEPGIGSPVIGRIGNMGRTSSLRLKTGEKRQRRGMSLKKPVHETILERPAQESVAGAENLQEQGSELSKTARKLDYVGGTDTGDGDERVGTGYISGIEDLSREISEPGKCAASETEALPSSSGLAGGRPLAKSTDASEKDDMAAGNEEPFLHMSEIGDFETPAIDTACAPALCQGSEVPAGDKWTTDCLEETVLNNCKDAALAQALGNKSTEAKDGSGDRISAVEPIAEGKDTVSEQTKCDDEMPLLVDADCKDEPEKVLSGTEEEGDRTSTVKGRKNKAPPAKKARTKKEAAPPSSKKDASPEPAVVVPRRSSGRQNAGAKMKSLLSLEKRTSASGKFREDGLSQETCEKRDASDGSDTREALNTVPKRTSKRGQKDSAKEATSSPLVDDLPKASSLKRTTAPQVGVEGPKFPSKCDSDLPRGEGSSRKDADTDKDLEERTSEVPFADQEGECSDDVGSIVSFLPPGSSISDDYVNATIDTCFSEPFPSFSQVLAECRDPEKAAAEDIKSELNEESEEEAPDLPIQNEDENATKNSVVQSNQDPAPEEHPKAPQSKCSKGGAAVVRSLRKKSVPVTEMSSTRRRAVHHSAQDSLPAASEVLVEDTEFQESEAPKSTLSRRALRARPPATESKRAQCKREQLDVTEETEKPEDNTEVDDVQAECGADEGTPSELQQTEEALESTSRQLQRTRHKASPSAVRPKRAGRKVKQLELAEETEQPEDDTEVDDVQAECGADEGTPSELQQMEAFESTSSRQSRRTRQEASPSAVGQRGAGRKVKQLEAAEETEQPEDNTEVDDVHAECGTDEDTASELQKIEAPESTSSRRSRRTTREASPSAVGPKRARRKANQLEVAEETEQPEGDAVVDDVQAESGADEDTPSELQQMEAPESTSSLRTRRGTSRPAIEPMRARRKAKLPKVVEESELPEDKTEEESVHVGDDRPTRVRKTPTPSQEEKSASRSRSTKISRLGMKKAKQSHEQDAELLDEFAATTAEDHTEETGLHAAENARGKRSTKLSLDRNSKPAADDSDFELNESQRSRTSQRGKRVQKLSQEQDSRSLVEKPLDDSALNSSVESESQTSLLCRRKGAKQSQGQDDMPHDEGTAQHCLEDTPALDEAAADSSLVGVSLLSGSQSPRTSRRGKKERKLSQEGIRQPLVEKDTAAELQSTKTSRRAGKGTKLSQQKDQKPSIETAIISTPNESGVEPKPEAVGASQHGKGCAKQLEIQEDLLAVESVASDATEDSAVSVETRNVRAPRGGKKGTKQGDKKLESSAVNTTDGCSEATTTQSPRSSRHVGIRANPSKNRGNRGSEEKTLATSTEVPLKAEPAVAKASQRGRKTKAYSGQANQEQSPKSEAIKTSSRNKKQSIDEAEVVVEAIDEPRKKPSTRCREPKMAPSSQAPVGKKRNARGRVKEDSPPPSTKAVEETLEETSPNCSPAKKAKTKRHVASMSFGEGRRESEGEATSNEEVELEEIEMMPGPKSKWKPAAKNIVKQEVVVEAPKRGKRKAALPEAVPLGTPPKVKPEPTERGAVMSPPSGRKPLKRKPKILFTGIDCTNEEEIVKELGGAIATTASTCTHLVTDKFRRTVKSLCCIGKGTPIVDVAWIKKCQEAKTFVEHVPFLLKDRKAEKSLKFVLDETLRQASDSGVLQGWSIHATAHVLPSPADLKEIVSCAGGKYLAKMPTRATGGSTVIVSCKDDLKACVQARKNGVPIVSVEFVLSGLLQYKLDVGAHSLD